MRKGSATLLLLSTADRRSVGDAESAKEPLTGRRSRTLDSDDQLTLCLESDLTGTLNWWWYSIHSLIFLVSAGPSRGGWMTWPSERSAI